MYLILLKFCYLIDFYLGQHTSNNIRIQYDSTLEAYEITNKVFKIASIQAAYCKAAFSTYNEGIDAVQKAQQLLNRCHRAELALELKKSRRQSIN